MSLRTALMAAIVLGFGGLGLVAWIGLQLPGKTAAVVQSTPVPTAKVQVLVAAHPLRAGSLLKFDDLQSREMLVSAVPTGGHVDTPQDRADLIGSMVRRSLQPQETLLPADLLRPGDHGFLAAVLRPGMPPTPRATS